MQKIRYLIIALLCAVAQGLVLTACSANEDAPVVDPQPLSPLEEALEDGSTIEFDMMVGDKTFNPQFLRENDAFTHLNPMPGGISTLMYNRVKNEMTLSYKRTNQQTRAEVDKPMPDAHEFWTCEDIDLPNPSAHYQIVFEGADNRGHGIGLDKIRVSADFDGFWGIL